VVAIDAGYKHNLALKSDGSVIAWGSSANGEIFVPADTACAPVLDISAGDQLSLALKDPASPPCF
jgi:alpha-tubulin suppressor-like RCC1 family protein